MALIKFTDTSNSPEPLTYVTNDISGYGVVGQADVPGLTANQQQRKVEEIQRKVIMPLVNANIDDTCAVSVYDTNADGRVDGADEADTLTTARTIGLTDADGTNTGTSASFDGSADVTLKLPASIKANVTGAVTGNITGDVSGNAGTATQLATERTLAVQDYGGTHSGAGVSFDGTANATMKLPSTIAANFIGDVNGNAASADKWKTSRNFTIKDADSTNSGVAASVDGSAAATLNLPSTIKASITGNVSGSSGSCTGNAATATALATAQNITIGSKTNSFDGSAAVTYTLSDIGAAAASHSHAESDVTNLVTDLAAKLPLSGGTMTGALILSGAPTMNLEATTKKYVDDSISFAGGGDMMKTVYDTNADGVVNAADTAAACTGNAATATTAAACSGNAATATTATTALACSGNSETATKLAATKNITVGSKTNAFDGSADITFSLADAGAAAASHTHGNITTDGKIGSTSGRIVTTGTAGAVGVQTKLEADIAELDANDKVKADEASARIVAVTASKTLELTDAGTLQKCTNSTAATITIPLASSVAFPIGTEIEFVMYGDGSVTIDGTAVTMYSADSYDTVSTKYKSCALKKMATDEWLLTGAEE